MPARTNEARGRLRERRGAADLLGREAAAQVSVEHLAWGPPAKKRQRHSDALIFDGADTEAHTSATHTEPGNLRRSWQWLAEASETAYGDIVTGLLRLGPAGILTKLVQVSFLDPIYRDDTMSVGLRWEAAGTTGSLFPVLDATITICPEREQAARLALAGCYRPRWGAWVPH